jgi:hypothetical protein
MVNVLIELFTRQSLNSSQPSRFTHTLSNSLKSDASHTHISSMFLLFIYHSDLSKAHEELQLSWSQPSAAATYSYYSPDCFSQEDHSSLLDEHSVRLIK